MTHNKISQNVSQKRNDLSYATREADTKLPTNTCWSHSKSIDYGHYEMVLHSQSSSCWSDCILTWFFFMPMAYHQYLWILLGQGEIITVLLAKTTWAEALDWDPRDSHYSHNLKKNFTLTLNWSHRSNVREIQFCHRNLTKPLIWGTSMFGKEKVNWEWQENFSVN